MKSPLKVNRMSCRQDTIFTKSCTPCRADAKISLFCDAAAFWVNCSLRNMGTNKPTSSFVTYVKSIVNFIASSCQVAFNCLRQHIEGLDKPYHVTALCYQAESHRYRNHTPNQTSAVGHNSQYHMTGGKRWGKKR